MFLAVLLSAVLAISLPAAVDPNDLESSYQNLQKAVAQKDADLVKKLADETLALTRKVMAEPEPDDEFQKSAWKSETGYAREIATYTEYALFATAVASPPATTVELMAKLEAQNPKSKYLNEGYDRYFYALHQTGASAKIPDIAQKALANLPKNPDLLMVLADHALTRRQYEAALSYANRLVAAANQQGKPEVTPVAEWERKRTAELGRGYWIAGLVQSERKQYYEADKNLRAALKLTASNQEMTAHTLFHLGVANYQLGSTTMNKAQVLEAIKFSEQCAAIKSPLSQQAWRNAQAMKQAADRMR
jgi:tetratricopeptide (TPR) repeat protein